MERASRAHCIACARKRSAFVGLFDNRTSRHSNTAKDGVFDRNGGILPNVTANVLPKRIELPFDIALIYSVHLHARSDFGVEADDTPLGGARNVIRAPQMRSRTPTCSTRLHLEVSGKD
jgi:hypothetical protein